MHRRRRRLEKWRTHLKAIEIVVVVVKQRNIHITVGRHQPSIAGFIGDQFLRLELAVAADAQVNGQRRHRREVRELNVRRRDGTEFEPPG